MNTNDDTIFETEGTLPDGRRYHADFWQLGQSYHMTLFLLRLEGETAEQAANFVEDSLLEFRGTKYRRVEPVFVRAEPGWSYNVVVCDDEEQFVAQMPLPEGVESFSVGFGKTRSAGRRPRCGQRTAWLWLTEK